MFSIQPTGATSSLAAPSGAALLYPAGNGAGATAGAPVLRFSDSRKPRRAAPASDGVERVLARVLGDDPTYARKVARVRRYQGRLRGRLDALSWQLYLQVEEAEIGRWTYALERVVDGLRRPRRRRR